MSEERLIVVGVDGSAGGRRALSWALDHAVDTGATVQVVTAYAGADAMLAAYAGSERRAVDAVQEGDIEAASAGRENLPVIVREVAAGDTVSVLTNAARGADVLILGSHGHSHIRSALLGSVSEGCIRHGSCPVVVVPTPKPQPRQRDVVRPAQRGA